MVNPNHCFLCGNAKRRWLARGTDYEYATTDVEFDFYQCEECSLIFIDPIPDESMLDVIYPPDYYAYSTQYYSKFISAMRDRQLDSKVRKFLAKSGKAGHRGLRVLEIGCGRGELLLALKRYDPTMSLMGVDFSEDAIVAIKTLGFSGQAGDIKHMDLGGRKFDIVICQQLLEHLHAPLQFLQKVKSWLRSDGVLILETPGVESIDRTIFKGCWGGYHIPRHFFLFSEKTIRVALQRTGFVTTNIFYDTCLAFWVWSLHNVIVKYTKAKKIANFFSLRNPIALFPFWVFEHIRMPFMKTASMGVVCTLQ